MFNAKTAQAGAQTVASDKKTKAVFMQAFTALNSKYMKALEQPGYVEEDNRGPYKRFLQDKNEKESTKLPEMIDIWKQLTGGYIELILAEKKYGYCVCIRDGDREYRQEKAEWLRIAHMMVQMGEGNGLPGILSLEIERDLTRHITKKLCNGFQGMHDAITGFAMHKDKHSNWEFSTSGSSSVWRSNDGRIIQWNGNREDPKVLELKWVSYRLNCLPRACNKMIEQVETFVEKMG